VSPLWNKTLTLHIDAQQLRLHLRQHATWLQRAGFAKPRGTKAAGIPAAGLQVASELVQPLPQALEALFAGMQERADIRNARLQVILDNTHVHFDVVQGDFADYSEQQLQAIAQGCVAELLGDDATGQQLRWQLQPDGQHLLLCAIATPVIDAVVQAAAQHGLRLTSMLPAFCAHWNRHGGALPQGSGVFTLNDAGHSLTVCARRGSIMALSLGRDGTTQSLDQRVNRLLASLGAQAKELTGFVLVARDPAALAPSPRWTVRDWQEQAR